MTCWLWHEKEPVGLKGLVVYEESISTRSSESSKRGNKVPCNIGPLNMTNLTKTFIFNASIKRNSLCLNLEKAIFRILFKDYILEVLLFLLFWVV